MRKAIASMILIAMISPVYAKHISCIGMDATNKTIKFLGDINNGNMIINGTVYKPNGNRIGHPKYDSDVVFSESFITVTGQYTYLSFGVYRRGEHKGQAFLAQLNAATNKLIMLIEMSCTKS